MTVAQTLALQKLIMEYLHPNPLAVGPNHVFEGLMKSFKSTLGLGAVSTGQILFDSQFMHYSLK